MVVEQLKGSFFEDPQVSTGVENSGYMARGPGLEVQVAYSTRTQGEHKSRYFLSPGKHKEANRGQ